MGGKRAQSRTAGGWGGGAVKRTVCGAVTGPRLLRAHKHCLEALSKVPAEIWAGPATGAGGAEVRGARTGAAAPAPGRPPAPELPSCLLP